MLYHDWLALAFLEKVSDPNGAKHPKGRSGHWGQTPFPLYPIARGLIMALVPVVVMCHLAPRLLARYRERSNSDSGLPTIRANCKFN